MALYPVIIAGVTLAPGLMQFDQIEITPAAEALLMALHGTDNPPESPKLLIVFDQAREYIIVDSPAQVRALDAEFVSCDNERRFGDAIAFSTYTHGCVLPSKYTDYNYIIIGDQPDTTNWDKNTLTAYSRGPPVGRRITHLR